MTYLLDSDTFTLAFHGQTRVASRLAAARRSAHVGLPEVTRMEALRGRFAAVLAAEDGTAFLRAAEGLRRTEQFLAEFPVTPFDGATAEVFDRLRSAAMTPSPPSLPEVLTLAEAAELLRVPVEGLKADFDAGRLPGRTVAGEWRCGRAALLAWLEAPQPPRRNLTDPPLYRETPEEFAEFMEQLAENRRKIDAEVGSEGRGAAKAKRPKKSAKVAP